MNERVSLRLETESINELDALADSLKLNRSEVIRGLLDGFIASKCSFVDKSYLELIAKEKQINKEKRLLKIRHYEETKIARIKKYCFYTLYYSGDKGRMRATLQYWINVHKKSLQKDDIKQLKGFEKIIISWNRKKMHDMADSLNLKRLDYTILHKIINQIK